MTLHSHICNHISYDIKKLRPQKFFCSLSYKKPLKTKKSFLSNCWAKVHFERYFYFFNNASISLLRFSNFVVKSSITSLTVEIRVERYALLPANA